MYDVSNKSSYENIANWSNTIDQNCDKSVIKLLVANKIDIPAEKRVITHE